MVDSFMEMGTGNQTWTRVVSTSSRLALMRVPIDALNVH
ncbi:hypothetical protein SLEP1_g22844 [Rubroshorea leprosula]|uniref:Uncharacterized protein n=1 Tax=Rubroshorea leprosula TaxID=152421 RepID=A0AAV5JHQ7_9ROSI|nr:hypothetical protein SLEP1_g22844 [Rubroshorea leprosula]